MRFDLSSFFFSPSLFFFFSSFHHSFSHTDRLYIYIKSCPREPLCDQTPFERNNGTMTFRNTFCTLTCRVEICSFDEQFREKLFPFNVEETRKKFGPKRREKLLPLVNECSNGSFLPEIPSKSSNSLQRSKC